MSQPQSAKQAMINTVAILTVLFVAWFIIQIRSTLLLLLIGILFAAAIEPLVNRLRRRGLSRGQSIVAVYLVLLGVISLIVLLVAPPLVRQGTRLFDDIPNILENLEEEAKRSDSEFISDQGSRAAQEALDAYERLRANPPIEQDQALSFATSVGGGIFTTVTVLIVAFYWLTEKSIVKRLVLGLFPIERRDRAHALWDEIESRIGGWTRGQLTLCLVIGVLSTIAYRLIGLDFWLALGLFAGITEIIPFLGPVLGGGAAFMVALTDSWQKAIIVLIFALALQQLEGAFLVPRVMKNAVGMTPLTVILAVLIGGSLAGPLGSILAIPVGAACQVLLVELLRGRADDPDVRNRSNPPPADGTGPSVQ
ncbi:MAG: AI-2E family transporter [Thermomicrobiales bacterium]|nr:AI-2E family transporter [Thermomicrobiales bacterium]